MEDKGRTVAGNLTDQDFQDQAQFRYGLRQFLRFSEVQARRAGVTPQQHLLLLLVRGHPSYPRVTIGDVAERLQVKHHSASLLIERTVQRGLLTKVADEADRRRNLVSLTAEGEGVLECITLANREELGALDKQIFKASFVEELRKHRRKVDQ